MTNLTMRQRSQLVQVAERGLNREPSADRGDYIVAAVGIVGCVVILILAALGVV
jgi:hypothetical protein